MVGTIKRILFNIVTIAVVTLLIFIQSLSFVVITKAADLKKEIWEYIGYGEYCERVSKEYKSYNGKPIEPQLLDSTDGNDETMLYKFNAIEAGLYNIKITYSSNSNEETFGEISLRLDGEIPFKEASSIVFSKAWKDSSYNEVDNVGNQIKAEQVEIKRTLVDYCKDSSGISNTPLLFAIKKGDHLLQLEIVEKRIRIEKIEIVQADNINSYSDYINTNENSSISEKRSIIQCEEIYEKSETTIFPSCDRGSATVEPVATDKIKFNYLSGKQFSKLGQWVVWKINVPEDGVYSLSFKYRQTEKDGGFSVKKLFIGRDINNLEAPFKETEYLNFPYSDKWKLLTASAKEGNAKLFLTKGDLLIKLESAMGDLSQIVAEVDDLLLDLNDIYRKITMVTGPVPDVFRDYKFDKIIPDEIQKMKKISLRLIELKKNVEKSSSNGSFGAQFNKVINDLEVMGSTPSEIASRINNFKVNLGGMAEWSNFAKSQAVDFDYIELTPYGVSPKNTKAGFFTQLLHNIRLFINSFTEDYSMTAEYINKDNKKNITIWLESGGKDQFNIIRQMVANDFTPKNNINVKLQIVPGGLLPSTMAGVGPDIALFASNAEPMNYAIRGAVTDLTQFNNYDEVFTRFHPQAYVPYIFNNKTYAIPETMTYNMLFYRKDILKELKISIPKNWDEVTESIIQLQRNNMSFGLNSNVLSYYMFLYQSGGSLFKENGKSINIDDVVGISSFKKWTDYYKDYSLNVQFDFLNRFRSGEMPMGISDFSTYNTLSVFAPELKGLWDMELVPGTIKDGKLDRSVAASGTANMLMEQSRDKESAWTYLTWWSEAKTQLKYANELEIVLGLAGRYPTANKEAFDKISWNRDAKENLRNQREFVFGIPEVPGSYIVGRNINFAFQSVVNKKEEPGQQLLKYCKDINKELIEKRKEFGLND